MSGGQRQGPIGFQELRRRASAGQVTPTDQVWSPSANAWVSAKAISELFADSRETAAPEVGRSSTAPDRLAKMPSRRWPIFAAGTVGAAGLIAVALNLVTSPNREPVTVAHQTASEQNRSGPEAPAQNKETRQDSEEINPPSPPREGIPNSTKDTAEPEPSARPSEPSPTTKTEVTPPPAVDDPPKVAPAAKTAPRAAEPEEFRTALTAAGFDAKFFRPDEMHGFVRFGSKTAADRYFRGDKFDHIEVENQTSNHRLDLSKRTFKLTGLPFHAIVRDDIETIGLVGELELPMRIRGKGDLDKDLSGNLRALHRSELDFRQFSFLTKQGKLLSCTATEAVAVRRNNGVLYHPERENTTLVLLFRGELDSLKTIARNEKDYSVEIVFSDLRSERPFTWGYFRVDAYRDERWDCERLRKAYDLGLDFGPQPGYFVTAEGGEAEKRIPKVVETRLESLRVVDKEGRTIGGWAITSPSATVPSVPPKTTPTSPLQGEKERVADVSNAATTLDGDPVHQGRPLSSWIAMLKDGDVEKRRNAARSLETVGSKGSSAVGGLRDALYDSDSVVASSAATALGKMGKDGVDPLIAALSDERSDVRLRASTAIEDVGPPAIPRLIGLLSSSKQETVVLASVTLSRIGTPAIPQLQEALKSDYHQVRGFAVLALAGMGRSASPALSAIRELTHDSHPGVRNVAEDALRAIQK
jgi:hypothetical protein